MLGGSGGVPPGAGYSPASPAPSAASSTRSRISSWQQETAAASPPDSDPHVGANHTPLLPHHHHYIAGAGMTADQLQANDIALHGGGREGVAGVGNGAGSGSGGGGSDGSSSLPESPTYSVGSSLAMNSATSMPISAVEIDNATSEQLKAARAELAATKHQLATMQDRLAKTLGSNPDVNMDVLQVGRERGGITSGGWGRHSQAAVSACGVVRTHFEQRGLGAHPLASPCVMAGNGGFPTGCQCLLHVLFSLPARCRMR
jgi:hypothetical protein